ncbi:MAG: hypothetical protein EOL95_02275 [Bacteroidia bacterium]|nr:hypothetical protein [Bacteroidia bacterium]
MSKPRNDIIGTPLIADADGAASFVLLICGLIFDATDAAFVNSEGKKGSNGFFFLSRLIFFLPR